MVRGSRSTAVLAVGMLCLESALAIIDVGGEHVCATVGTTPKCWGANRRGQLGRGDGDNTGDGPDEMGENLVAVNPGTGESVADLALGEEHTCMLLDSGNVKCFGYNDVGQLGLGDTVTRGLLPNELGDALPAVDFGTGLSAVAVTAGCRHTCALLDDGSVKCFGYNSDGQLGQGTTENVGDDMGEMGDNLTAVPLGSTGVAAIAAGCDFTCALMEDGAVMCWGRNTFGQLGTGDSDNRLDGQTDELVAVDLDGSVVIAIGAGEGHVCALTDDSSLKCWGHNNRGQLGLGDNTDRGDPAASLGASLLAVELGTADVPIAMECGDLFTCVLLEDSSIKCFGDNTQGQLGIGSDEDIGDGPLEMGANLTAVDLGGLASDVAAGGKSVCAVLSGDSIKCWGQGNRGQLGQGTDDSIGEIPGELAELDPVDIGTDTFASSTAPTPSATVTSVSPSTAPTSSPTVGDDTTVAPGGSPAPSAPEESAAPSSSVDLEVESDSGAPAHFAGGLLVTVVLGTASCMAALFL